MTPQEMKARLEATYQGADVDVQDLTGTQDHYQVVINASEFKGMSRIERHQAVMQVFDDELKSGEVHALTIKANSKGDGND